MNPETLIGYAVAFALGVLVRDVAQDYRTPDPAPAHVQATSLPPVCAHFQTIGQGWRCQ
jgi:hypothetical protein